MRITVKLEAGYEEAMEGLSYSYNTSIDKAKTVSKTLFFKDGGHNKFLESMVVWLEVDAPRYFWSQFDTYRAGITKQSESTMHTLLRTGVDIHSFEDPIPQVVIDEIDKAINNNDLDLAKAILPESFLQKRMVCTNYKTLRNIILQRRNHKLTQWHVFCDEVLRQVKFPGFLER